MDDLALAKSARFVPRRSDLGHPYTVAFAHYTTSVCISCAWTRSALESAERSFEISQEQRFSLYVKIENFTLRDAHARWPSKTRSSILSPSDDGTYVVEFRTAAGERLFLNSSENWAERAAELGWNTRALFGCHRNDPLMHLGSAGLLWAINGGKLVELHRDGAGHRASSEQIAAHLLPAGTLPQGSHLAMGSRITGDFWAT